MPRFAEKPEEIPTQQVEYAADPEAGGPRFEDGASLAGFTTTTTEKAGSSKYADSTIRLEHVKASKANERKLVRKLGAWSTPSLAATFPPPLTVPSAPHLQTFSSSLSLSCSTCRRT